MSERRIQLTDDQYERLSAGLNADKFAGKFLAAMLNEFCEARVKEQERTWNTIYRLAGVSRNDAEYVTVDWVNRCIVVKEKDNAETEN